MCSSDIFLGLIAILFPPIAGKPLLPPLPQNPTPKKRKNRLISTPIPTVWIKVGICTADSIINLLLCTLGYIPGLLHAWYIIAKNPELNDDEYEPIDGGESRVTYYYVDQQPPRRRQGEPQAQYEQQQQQQQRGYGTQGQGDVLAGQNQSLQQPGGQWRAESREGQVPPSYEQAVKGDHKVQD